MKTSPVDMLCLRTIAALLTLATVLTLVALLLTGCASFVTEQTDTSTDEKGTQRTITTRAKATTFWASGSDLSNFKASQTDKTQSATVGALSQTATATNIADIVGAAVGAAVRATVKPP